MATKPELRYVSAPEIRDEVGRWLAAERVEADREPWIETARRWARKHKTTVGIAAAVFMTMLVAGGAFHVWDRLSTAARLVDMLLIDDTTEVPRRLEAIQSLGWWADTALRAADDDDAKSKADHDAKKRPWRAVLALRNPDQKDQNALLNVLIDHKTPAAEAAMIVKTLSEKSAGSSLQSALWAVIQANETDAGSRFCAICAWVGLTPKGQPLSKKLSPEMLDVIVAHTPNLVDYAEALELARNDLKSRLEAEALQPVEEELKKRIERERQAHAGPALPAGSPARRRSALRTLADWWSRHDPKALADLWLRAAHDDADFVWWYVKAGGLRETVKSELGDILAKPLPADADSDWFFRCQAQAAVGLVRLDDFETVKPKLRHAEDPRLRTYFVHGLGRSGVTKSLFANQLASRLADVNAGRARDDDGVVQGLIVALGLATPNGDRDLSQTLIQLYEDDPDPGVHAAARRTLTQWRDQVPETATALQAADGHIERLIYGAHDKRDWFSSKWNRHTLAIIRCPPKGSFAAGDALGLWKNSKPDDAVTDKGPEAESFRTDRNEQGWEAPLKVDFAIATTETTKNQFNTFIKDLEKKRTLTFDWVGGGTYSPRDDCPALKLPWYFAIRYCNWLTRKEFCGDDELCYDIPGELSEDKESQAMAFEKIQGRGPSGLRVAEFWKRKGYRLPTEAEWEYACRARTITPRYYGSDPALLTYYAAYIRNSPEQAQPVGSLIPNRFGLFDMLGNAFEWCDFTPGTKQDQHPVERWEYRPVRGGSYFSKSSFVRAEYRISFHYGEAMHNTFGFRIARSLPGGPIKPKQP
jgi:formylglycine-generating enzyme required for sulfatase activity